MFHYKIKVKGKVQGVFFRANTKDVADQLGITGWVKNEPDGSVFLEAEGSKEQLEKLVNWCKKGPTRARVEELEVEEGILNNYKEFKVIR